MSMAVQTQNFIQNIFPGTTSPTTNTAAAVATASPYSSDQVQVSSTTEPPEKASFFKKMGDSFGQMFSDMAYSMGSGETYRLVEQEFRQIDWNMDGSLNVAEFTMGTLNPFEFGNADTNYDNQISIKEYAQYRKHRLEAAFEQKDINSDRHLNVAEIGSVGRIYLANRDPRVDTNTDGFLNKREFVRANLTLGISIRDALGF